MDEAGQARYQRQTCPVKRERTGPKPYLQKAPAPSWDRLTSGQGSRMRRTAALRCWAPMPRSCRCTRPGRLGRKWAQARSARQTPGSRPSGPCTGGSPCGSADSTGPGCRPAHQPPISASLCTFRHCSSHRANAHPLSLHALSRAPHGVWGVPARARNPALRWTKLPPPH